MQRGIPVHGDDTRFGRLGWKRAVSRLRTPRASVHYHQPGGIERRWQGQRTKNRPMSRPVNPRVADIHAKIAPQDATMKGINFESGNLTKKYADAGWSRSCAMLNGCYIVQPEGWIAYKTMDPNREYSLPVRCASPIIPNTEENEMVCLSMSGITLAGSLRLKKIHTLQKVYHKHDGHNAIWASVLAKKSDQSLYQRSIFLRTLASSSAVTYTCGSAAKHLIPIPLFCFVSSPRVSSKGLSDIMQPMDVAREQVEIKIPVEETRFHRLYRPLLNSSRRAESPRRRLHGLSSGS